MTGPLTGPPATEGARRRGGLIVPVPEAEAAITTLPDACVPIWQAGIPAHVTLLFPFHTSEALGSDGVAALGRLLAAWPATQAVLHGVGQFPDVLYLAPEPRAWFTNLTDALAQRYTLQPYGGLHDDVVPHLTVTRHADPAVLARVGATLAPCLPIVTDMREVWLMEEQTDGHWIRTVAFPLGPPGQEAARPSSA